MVGPSKILTVSYGTFSCTLEGFDDPFSTMRGIAEYFRDLAADDRYFGAEPPIPDAEMLHRIAQQGAEKHVVTHVEDHGITLRQVDEDTATPPAPEKGSVQKTQEAPISAPFVDEPADLLALNEPSQVETESVAAKLARIRAVVSNDSVATDQQEISKDEVYTSSPISSAFEDTGVTADANDDRVVAEVEPESEVATEFGAETVDGLDGQAPDIQETTDQVPDIIDETMVQADPVAAIPEEVQPADDASEEAMENDGKLETVSESNDDVIAEFMGDAPQAEPEEDADETVSDLPLDDDSSTISRIIKMRRTDFDAAQDSGAGDFSGTNNAASQDAASQDNDSSLTPEDEAELMANLAQVQRKAEAEERAEKEGRALLENQDIEASADSVSRILDVTNTELDETEGTRRRSAIAHLKAAVAATRADRFLSRKRDAEDKEELDQYRDDLAKVVKPRRPSDAGKSARQAPLVLVSEQRVDQIKPEVIRDAGAVAPRRVSAGNLALNEDDLIAGGSTNGDNMFIESNGFAEFAEQVGASELPDLLEAAAAYSAFVEGQEHFSRPQIMQAVAAIREEEFSREEGLRSFGLLLRRGKIKKLKRGQFTIADTTRFHPRSRAVGE